MDPQGIGGEAASMLIPTDWKVEGVVVWRAHPALCVCPRQPGVQVGGDADVALVWCGQTPDEVDPVAIHPTGRYEIGAGSESQDAALRTATWGRSGFDGSMEGFGCVHGILGTVKPQGCLNADVPLALAA